MVFVDEVTKMIQNINFSIKEVKISNISDEEIELIVICETISKYCPHLESFGHIACYDLIDLTHVALLVNKCPKLTKLTFRYCGPDEIESTLTEISNFWNKHLSNLLKATTQIKTIGFQSMQCITTQMLIDFIEICPTLTQYSITDCTLVQKSVLKFYIENLVKDRALSYW